jgi:carbonic anhydrase
MKKVFAMTALALFSFACDRNEEAHVAPQTRPEGQNAQLARKSADQPAPADWDYERTTSAKAGLFKHKGKNQSPINIITKKTILGPLPDISFQYSDLELTEVNTGHTVEVEETSHNSIQINDSTYAFKQLHFHAHSEHAVNGQYRAMEMHLVHMNELTGKRVVLGVFIEPGAPNPLFQQVLDHLPAAVNEPVETHISFHLADWLPVSKDYYTYAGSLTTEPFSEGLDWYVFKEPIRLSQDQINAFVAKFHHNARPLQHLVGRKVYEKQGNTLQ